MSVHIVNAVRVNCDGHGCHESAVIQADQRASALPDGWYEIDADFADRKVFHQVPCLIGFVTAMSVSRRDDGGFVVGSVDDYLDRWIAAKTAVPA